MFPTSTVKHEARRIVEQLPDDATWDDLCYEIYVRQTIEAGLRDCQQGRTLPVAEVRHRLELQSVAVFHAARQAPRTPPGGNP